MHFVPVFYSFYDRIRDIYKRDDIIIYDTYLIDSIVFF
jgi:hypothetical protein